ncbi:hypothetical protein B0H11DRAFT_1977000 [Mycena galericulata]|nr:hypothetical protein B0H11DRAFT_1977000 [Mycena galericulata]
MKPTVQKENFPAQEPRTTQESKSSLQHSRVASVPLKSILKNTPTAIPSKYMPPPLKPPSDGADSPLTSPAYFMSPAETLLESMGPNADDISFHDLIEAYNTFSDRIRSQIRTILNVAAPHPALVSLREYTHQMVQALRRDLKHTREETASNPRRTSLADNSFLATAELDEEEVRVSRDLALLNHQVLRFLSDIFSFPPLYSIFSIDDLRIILSDLLVLGSAQYIPSPASRRTWTLIVWILSVQNLPSAVLSPAKREIVSVVKRALEGQIGKDQARLDALKASNQLLKQYPTLFISPLSDIFPCVLQNLIAHSPIMRLQAVNVLGRFALAKLSTLSTANTCHASISATLTTFINSQTSKLKSVQHQVRLRNLVTAAISADNPSHQADGPFWVVQLLASFVILLDDSFFSNPRALKLTLQSLEQLFCRKQKLLTALHPHVWKCLIWVFSRLPTTSSGEDTREPVFLTLKQDLTGDIGLALIYSLLGTTPNESCNTSDSVSKVLVVVEDMLSSRNQLVQVEGMALLTKLLYTPAQSSASAIPQNLLVPQLFDGSLLPAKRENVAPAIRSIKPFDITQVRQLSDSEIIRDWDILADLWTRATHISLRKEFGKFKLPPPYLSVAEYKQNLLHGWQSLLLMPTDLTQGLGHLTTQDPFASKIADLICAFIVPTDTADAQVEQLVLVSKMWRTMTNVFQPAWLSSPAETVLDAVLKQSHTISEEPVQDIWAQLCSELISFGLPTAVKVVMDRGEAQMSAEVQRQLWVLAVKSTQKPDTLAPWKDLAYLISVPFSAWTMSESEVEIWKGLLRTTISIANSDSVRPTVVVGHVFELVRDRHRFSESLEELSTLLSYVDLAEENALPEGVMDAVDKALYDLYPDQALVSASLQFIRRVGDIVLSAPSTLALPLLLALQNGICHWLEDDKSLLVGHVRKEVVQCLFSAPLSTIHDMEPSGQNLVSISRFLATVADAYAFERFWRATYHGREEFYALYPESIKLSLRSFGELFGGSLAADLSMETDSHVGSSCAPDSQPVQSSSFDYYADESRYPFDADTIGGGDTRFMDVDEHSASTIRALSQPLSPSIQRVNPQMQARPVPSAALDQLQDYSSRVESSLVNTSQHTASGSSRSSGTIRQSMLRAPSQSNRSVGAINFSAQSKPRSPKRRAKAEDTYSRKRRKTSPEAHAEHTRPNAIAGPSQLPGESISKPTSRRESKHALSQPIPSLKRRGKRKVLLDCVMVPTYAEFRRRYQAASLPTPSPSLRPPPPRLPPPGPDQEEEEEDYASWEAGLSMAELKQVQQTFGCDTEYPSSGDEDASSTSTDLGNSPRSTSPSPSLDTAERRSQTAPIPPREHHPLPLRRNKTSTRLDALERAYAAVADDASQPPIQDLVQATRWVHKIGAALNEQMSRKLDKQR